MLDLARLLKLPLSVRQLKKCSYFVILTVLKNSLGNTGKSLQGPGIFEQRDDTRECPEKEIDCILGPVWHWGMSRGLCPWAQAGLGEGSTAPKAAHTAQE